MPTRRGGGSRIALLTRTLLVLIRAVFINLMAMLGILIALAAPIGLIAATGHYGLAAFQEFWEHGRGDPYEARTKFNWLMKIATFILAFLPAMNLTSLVSGRITAEKDKKTWDGLLLTPMDGAEIIRSKRRSALQGLRPLVVPLLVVWGLGLACGVLTPLGVAVAALDLALVSWAGIALGLSLGLRPGETSVAATRATWMTLTLFAAHGLFLYGTLASPRELARWDHRLWWTLVLAGPMVPILTGLLAWRLTSRLSVRFDEWVGRPIAGGVPRTIEST